ncbi:MAG: nicotinate-nicotinamide nucleotide adenylyltransferase [Deltaproteobacteria bacterium]|jgi:nicotinate-nucleotide adenylyltransferase|nr:nicotinate-nicotinamide nucleotide adenylyltransferase [Deltaproteobacteria bacterium]
MNTPLRIGILGASFNPVHIGHLRLALELREMLALSRVDLLPCALPPHKPATGILPFALRVRLLRAAVQGIAGLRINPMEGEREGPSYTWDSLRDYAARQPEARCFFLLGCEDFRTLPQWRRGLELPQLADFAVVPRDGAGEELFTRAVRENWPEAVPCPPDPASRMAELPDARAFALPGGTRLLYLPLARLDISASLLRRRFAAGLDIRFLLPPASLECLEAERGVVEACWKTVAKCE